MNNPNRYLADLSQDVTALTVGPYRYDTVARRPRSYDDLGYVFFQTRYLGGPDAYDMEIDYDAADPHTAIGERLLGLVEEGVGFDSDESAIAGCTQAEWRLVGDLEPASIANTDRISPVIVTLNDEPVAIIKADNVKSCYALEDVISEETGRYLLIEGAFMDRHHGLQVIDLDASGMVYKVDLGLLHPMEPMRLGFFGVPDDARRKLRPGRKDRNKVHTQALQTNHDNLRWIANQLVDDAIEVDPKYIAPLIVPEESKLF